MHNSGELRSPVTAPIVLFSPSRYISTQLVRIVIPESPLKLEIVNLIDQKVLNPEIYCIFIYSKSA